MLVMKFGGSSVADARQIQKVLEIVAGASRGGPSWSRRRTRA
jgi:aspartokinase